MQSHHGPPSAPDCPWCRIQLCDRALRACRCLSVRCHFPASNTTFHLYTAFHFSECSGHIIIPSPNCLQSRKQLGKQRPQSLELTAKRVEFLHFYFAFNFLKSHRVYYWILSSRQPQGSRQPDRHAQLHSTWGKWFTHDPLSKDRSASPLIRSLFHMPLVVEMKLYQDIWWELL